MLCIPCTKYHSGDQIKTSEIGGEYSTFGESRGACRVLVGKSEGKRLLERPKRRSEDKIKMGLTEVG
jgi:hypothetical protein